MNNKKIHTHPQMEKDLNVPQDHCIIDRDMFNEISEDNKTNLKEEKTIPLSGDYSVFTDDELIAECERRKIVCNYERDLMIANLFLYDQKSETKPIKPVQPSDRPGTPIY